MTSQYTQTARLSPSNLMANAFSSKTQNYSNKSSEAFSSVLDKAAKPYTDKSENKNITSHDNKDYAQKTKDTHVKDAEKVKTHSDDSQVKNDKKTDKNKIKDNETPEKEHNKTSNNDSKETAGSETKETVNAEQNPIQDKSLIEQAAEMAAQTILDGTLAEEAAAVTANLTTEIDTTDTTDTPQQQSEAVSNAKTVSDKNVNTIVNEQILANIEYADTENLGVKAQSLANVDIDIDAVKKVIEQAKNGQSQTVPQTSAEIPVDTAKNQQTTEAVVENVKSQQTSETPDITVETNTSKTSDKPADTAFKSAKETLAADTSRMTANIEQAADDAVSTSAVKPVTPNDTEADKTPVIKVTNEVASQVRENTQTGIENKDTTTKVKGKALDEMTKLQDTDTVVTEARTESKNSNSSNNSGNTGANLSHGNAGELAAKLSVDQGAINNTQTGAEAFVNKLDAQLSAKGTSTFTRTTTLNQTDIMNQVNAKFEELQKSGNNKVSIILQPENLGRVSVEIMNSKDGIVAKMTTDSQQVKELFDKNVEALKSNLSSQGVNVNNIKVECTQESANHGMEQEQFNQSFDQQQNGQNQAHHSNQNAQGAYGVEYGTSSLETESEINNGAEIKNTDTIIKHNGKVDYTV